MSLKSQSPILILVLSLMMAGLAPLASAQSPSLESGQPKTPKVAELRLGVIGASISAGMSSQLTMAKAMQQSLRADRKALDATDAANIMTFLNPTGISAQALARMDNEKLQGVVAVDYLFWFTYGRRFGDYEARQKSLASALAGLEVIKVPLWLGDIPHITDASLAMLRGNAVPPAEDLIKLNAQIRTWAATRKNVTILPVVRWLKDLKTGQPVPELKGKPTFKRSDVLASDRLHLTKQGVLIAAQLILIEIAKGPLLGMADILPWQKALATLNRNAMSIDVALKHPEGRGQTGYFLLKWETKGLGLRELVPLADLRPYLNPVPIAGANPMLVDDIPLAGLKLQNLRVRAFEKELVSDWVPIKLTKGKKTKVTLTLAPGRSVKVRVVDEQGAALPGAKVWSRTESLARGRSQRSTAPAVFLQKSNREGRVTLRGLMSGSHDIVASFAESTATLTVATDSHDEVVLQILAINRDGR
ncbi:MAG: carboxypeptidase-like regulatory domain-containing protein [Planctomycetota bacterium]